MTREERLFVSTEISPADIPSPKGGRGGISRYLDEVMSVGPGQARRLEFEDMFVARNAACTIRAFVKRRGITSVDVMARKSSVYIVSREDTP